MQPAQADLEALRRLSTPTVSNAIELFDLRPRNEGYLSPEIRCLFPEMGVMVGYAVTARFGAAKPATHRVLRYESWKHLLSQPAPRVLVLQDMDQPTGIGAFVGEVMGTLYQRLGCVGAVTNGVVRDLDEVRALGFHFFAAGVGVSHAYVHLLEFGQPVQVGGATVRTGDLLHGDKHGVLTVPLEIVADLPRAAEQVAEREQRMMNHIKSSEFSLEKLKRLYELH
jgi:regulator of RNase E activity RraA